MRGVFGCVLMALVVLAGLVTHSVWPTRQATGDGGSAEVAEKRVPVVLTAAKVMDFELSVIVSGTVQAKNYALVSARMPGTLDAVHVDEGDVVEAGVTPLFQSDAMNLTRAVAFAEQGLQVAELSVKEKEASLEQMLADKQLAQIDLERYRNLIQDNAIPRQLFDQQETREKQACALVRHAQAQLDLEKAKLEQARLSLLMAQKDVADSQVLAPISGRVSQRYKEPGEMAAAGTPVLKIEDLSVLEISVFLPEEHFAMVVPGQTPMQVRVGGLDLGVRPVVYKSPTINQKLRTFEVKGLLESPPDGVAPGCLAEVVVVLDQRSGVGVPTPALQQRGGGEVVFLVEEGRARMVPVEAGRAAGGWTEILKDAVSSGTEVITMGQQQVTDAAPVTVVEERAQ
jgi:multidrug efflux pump subunit AcrA (membrane-fusion protein)